MNTLTLLSNRAKGFKLELTLDSRENDIIHTTVYI